MPDSPLILVDGTGFLFRAYYGIHNPLSTSAGQTTHAVYGVLNMLRSLIKEYQPQHLAVVLDAKGKTFRHDIYPEYKANRAPMPSDLRVQLEYLRKIVPALGVPLLSVPEVEADDVIGTLAAEATRAARDTLLISSDKDLAQLVNEHVVMLDTMKNTRLDADGVTAKFGVPPPRIVEYLALVGDSSDNIPGVPGVGARTAARWLNHYGSLDDLLKHAEEISGKVGESLRTHLEQLEMSRHLATIKQDVALEKGIDDLCLAPPDRPGLRALYVELEFHSLIKRLDEGGEKAPPAEAPRYHTITEKRDLKRWITKLRRAKIFAIDTETTSRDPHNAELVGLSFAVTPGEAAYIPLAHCYAGAPPQLPLAEVLAELGPLLASPKHAKTGQNLKYDMHVLARYDIALDGITHDTMLMSYLLEAGYARHDLDTLALKHLGHETIKFAEVAGRGRNRLTFDQVDLTHATAYAAEDADITLRVHRVLAPRLAEDEHLNHLFCDMELPLLHVLARIEGHGVMVDAAPLKRHGEEIAERLALLEVEARAAAGESFNIASPAQIQHILFDKLGIPVLRKTPGGQPSTAESVLQELAEDHPLPRLILEHRALAKLKTTYTDKLPQLVNSRTGRIHTSYHQAVANTGRLSSSDPNLQNIPVRTEAGRMIRAAFIAPPGYALVSADYSQIELRIMAHLSEDPALIEAFQQGLDVHAATAAEVFDVALNEVDAEQRRRAKAINFGLIYGMSAYGLARQLHIEQGEAHRYMTVYFDRYPGVKRYMEETREVARRQGYVETLYRRRMKLADIQSRVPARRQAAERAAINAPMQGSAADLIKIAMLAVDRWLREEAVDANIIMQVHDELILEVAEGEVERVARETARLMSEAATLRVPLVVDTGSGSNWRDAH